jgi:predicted Ser/Thr protein kinase
MEDFKAISVKEGPNHRVQFHNPTGYSLLGLGDQGAVFLLDSGRCVKIYAKEKNARKEAGVYKRCGHSFILPKLYECGPNYLILEYIRGLPLDEYIGEKAGIPFSLSIQLVYAIREMMRLGFTRLDIPMRHILVTGQDAVKVIDHVNSFTLKSPKPSSLFKAFKKMGLLELFMEHVKHIDKELYAKWNDKTMEDRMNG